MFVIHETQLFICTSEWTLENEPPKLCCVWWFADVELYVQPGCLSFESLRLTESLLSRSCDLDKCHRRKWSIGLLCVLTFHISKMHTCCSVLFSKQMDKCVRSMVLFALVVEGFRNKIQMRSAAMCPFRKGTLFAHFISDQYFATTGYDKFIVVIIFEDKQAILLQLVRYVHDRIELPQKHLVVTGWTSVRRSCPIRLLA